MKNAIMLHLFLITIWTHPSASFDALPLSTCREGGRPSLRSSGFWLLAAFPRRTDGLKD